MSKCLLFIGFLLLTAQAHAQITVAAIHYNISSEGDALDSFNVHVQVQAPGLQPYEIVQENVSGSYTFEHLPKGSTLTFSAEKTNAPKAYVGTYDLVLISKHWMGVEPLISPDQWIAADADCNDTITTYDIVAARKLVLNIYPNICRYWLLLDDSVELPENPLGKPYPTQIVVKNYDGRPFNLRFRAIKIGNVNSYLPQRPIAVAPAGDDWLEGPHPNPVSDGASRFTIRLDAPETIVLQMFDASGRQLHTQQWPGQTGLQQLSLDAALLPNKGVYFWRITVGREVKSGKLLRG